jgi:hypothetical protein
VQVLKAVQPRQQPQRRERGEGRQPNGLAVALLAQLAHGGVELHQHRIEGAPQRRPCAGERHVARAAREQGRADLLLEAADLAADGRLREMQLLGCTSKTGQAGHRFEGP